MSTTVGFIGLGNMGVPMAARVASVGWPLVLWNRTASKSESLARDLDCTAADTPGQLAERADVIITMVADDSALQELYLGEPNMLDSLKPETLCIDMSTISPALAVSLAEALRPRRAHFIDAPVSGSVAAASAGELTIMVGGEEEMVEVARPLLEAMGSKIFHMGSHGAGATIKLAVNSIIYGLSQALSEALVLAERAGISRSLAYDVFASSAVAAPFVAYRRDAFLDPDRTPVAFRMELAGKDLDLVLDLATEVGAAMSQAELNREVIRQSIASGLGDHDMSAVADYLRKSSGIGSQR
ncbi:MAG: NAD(P)-dependent oxidoreductase [Acidimicrobiia bacterium]